MAGELRIAQGIGKLPAVVLMHGSGGVSPTMEAWTRQLNSMGISTFVIDGFSGRGLTSVNQDQAKLGRLNFILDIYGALEIVAKHPRVDPERIVLMGFSRGGQAALYASLKRFNEMWNRSGAQFAAYIPFYPDCATTYATDTEVVERPIRIFHGSPDDYNPVATCKAYRRAAAGGQARRGADRISGLRSTASIPGCSASAAMWWRTARRPCATAASAESEGGVLDQHRDQRAVQLQGCLRGAEPACRRQSGDRARGAQGGERIFAGAVQAELTGHSPVTKVRRARSQRYPQGTAA